jgi:SAM-dependent methyltransferase
MEELLSQLKQYINEHLYQVIISNPRNANQILKIKIRPVLIKNELLFQVNSYIGKQVFHENLKQSDLLAKIEVWMNEDFRQLELESKEVKLTALISKKGNCTVKTKKHANTDSSESIPLDYFLHNRKKNYLLEEGKPIAFLQKLGILTAEGKIVQSKYDKWKQINRYLEFVEDVIDQFDKTETIRIVDFGCGKSYLTFVLYYYLKEVKGFQIEVTGLDLKKEVIEHCNQLAEEFSFTHLKFLHGDIASFEDSHPISMVVSLHACDTATDYALKKAVDWGAKVIFAVPCCQHEVNNQIQNELLAPFLKYGLLKERMSALITDGIRANLLEEAGYDTQVLEFVDTTHTPKNILLRGIKRTENVSGKETGLKKATDFLSIETTLQKLI